ncbi:hypothetical protein [Actinomadura citrea]|uniref:Uncharacterized protein n=1 Tax=Actinomadura citrea TaxID=46158 RepID=A0A7Y9G7V9_9ACTN|nr:hypothetical protein [Actinomadura citrea]NYE10205.1 hypothetical protein [Actinomadura citrea]
MLHRDLGQGMLCPACLNFVRIAERGNVMKFRNLACLAITALLAAGCAGGAGANSKGDSEKGTKMPKASSFEEIAELLKPALGSCQRMQTTGPGVELQVSDRSRGGKKKAICWYQEQKFAVEFLLIDTDNSTIERFYKNYDSVSSERVGMGFTVRDTGGASDEIEAILRQKLKESGLKFLNCESDFTPYSGIEFVEAKTKGCRYTSVQRF